MRAIIVIAFCLFTIYAPLELSRLIFAYGLEFSTIFELCAMWTLYLTALAALAWLIGVLNGTRTS